MKKWIVFFVLSVLSVSCTNAETQVDRVEANKESVAVPDTLKLPQDTVRKRIQADIDTVLLHQRSKLIREAVEVIAQTQALILQLDSIHQENAERIIAELIGKIEILTAAHPELSLLPIDVHSRVNEVITDIHAIKGIVGEAEKAMDKGYYQVARTLLNDLASEIVISTVNLPLATYPQGLKEAAVLIRQKRLAEASDLLKKMLNTLVITEQIIPLPVMRAQQYVIEALALDLAKAADREEIIKLLDNADYQLKLAEALGYGKRTKDYKDLYKAIHDIKRSIEREEAAEAIIQSLEKLKEQLSKFRQKHFSTQK